jgi:hypothetical protein
MKGNIMIEVTEFGGQNWLITPAARAVGEAAPKSISDQEWLLVLSGVGVVNMQGKDEWLTDEVHILPDTSGPLDHAINRWGIPQPQSPWTVGFQLDQWSPLVGLSDIFDQDQSVNAGFAVDSWRPSPFATWTDAFTDQQMGNIFTGIIADVAVRDSDAFLRRVGYNITLAGRIVFTEAPVIE